MKLLYLFVLLSLLSFLIGCALVNTPKPKPVPPASTSTSQPPWCYYDGMLYMLAMLHASGNFKIYIQG
jgi:hypothetical protein